MQHTEHLSVGSSFLKNLLGPSSAFAIVFIFLVFQYTFKMDFECPCNAFNNQLFCGLYLFLPSFGLFSILTFTTTACTIMVKRCCCCLCSEVCWQIACKHFFRNLFFSVLWIVTIFIDGNAYVCFKLTEKNITHSYDQIPCKKDDKLTAEESEKIKHSLAESQVSYLPSSNMNSLLMLN